MDLIWLLLFVFGIFIMAAEAFIFTFGALAITGAILFFFALMMLQVGGFVLGFLITANVLMALGGFGLIILLAVVYFAVRAYSKRAKPLLEGETVEIVEWTSGSGRVRLKGGEIWSANAPHQYHPGDKARVIKIENLTLTLGDINHA